MRRMEIQYRRALKEGPEGLSGLDLEALKKSRGGFPKEQSQGLRSDAEGDLRVFAVKTLVFQPHAVFSQESYAFSVKHNATQLAGSDPNAKTLIEEPFFCKFIDARIMNPGAVGVSTSNMLYYKLMADAIPALSFAAGRNPLQANVNNNVELGSFKTNTYPDGWPRSNNSWRHSDFKDVAYPFNFKLFDDIVTNGGLK